jgi:hypothetical protein
MDTSRDHFAAFTTPSGSAVVVPFLTESQAADVAAQYGPPAEPIPLQGAAAEEDQDCQRCDGNGYWYEPVEVTTPNGSTITTQKRVNCRLCGGTGRVSKK